MSDELPDRTNSTQRLPGTNNVDAGTKLDDGAKVDVGNKVGGGNAVAKSLPSAPTFFGSALKKSFVHLAAMAIGAATVYLYPSEGDKTFKHAGVDAKTGLTAADTASLAKQQATGGQSQADRRAAALKEGQALLDAARTRPENRVAAKAMGPAEIRNNNAAAGAVDDANSTGGHKQGNLHGAMEGAGWAFGLSAVASLLMRRKFAKTLKESNTDFNFVTDTQGLSRLVYGRTPEEVKNNLELKKFGVEGIATLRNDFATHQAAMASGRATEPFKHRETTISDQRGLDAAIEAEKASTWGNLLPPVYFPWRNKGENTRLPYKSTEIPKDTVLKTTTDLDSGKVEREKEVEKTTQLFTSAAHGTSNGERFATPKPVRWWHFNN